MFYIMSEVERESFTKFVEVNGDWLVMFVGVLGAFVSVTMLYCLRSRCTNIRCFCVECIRQPISEENVNNVSLA